MGHADSRCEEKRRESALLSAADDNPFSPFEENYKLAPPSMYDVDGVRGTRLSRQQPSRIHLTS